MELAQGRVYPRIRYEERPYLTYSDTWTAFRFIAYASRVFDNITRTWLMCGALLFGSVMDNPR